MFVLPPSPSPIHQVKSVEMLMNWKDSGTSTKSDAEVNRLANNVLLDPDFKLEDLQGFNVARENKWGDTVEKKSPFSDSFQMADINIQVPSSTSGIPPGESWLALLLTICRPLSTGHCAQYRWFYYNAIVNSCRSYR